MGFEQLISEAGLDQQVMVFDDFCPGIEAVVESAHSAGFGTWLPNTGKVGSSVYEGMAFWGLHSYLLRDLSMSIGGVVVPNTMFFRVTNEDTEQAYIHSDRETGNWTCVVYLTDHDSEYGTAFYRHKPTGLVEMPSFEEMNELGIFEQLKEDMETRNPDHWEMILSVPGKRNRAVVFEAPLFHSRLPLNGIGSSEQDGRLIWASHFYRMNGYGQLF